MDLLFTYRSSSGCRVEGNESRLNVVNTEDVGELFFDMPVASAEDLRKMTVLCAVIGNDSRRCEGVMAVFTCRDGRRLSYHVKLMPSLRVNLLFRLKYLSGELTYPPMEPGTLKSSFNGRDARTEDVVSMSLRLEGRGLTYTLEGLRFSDSDPAPVPADHVLCDSFGQWTDREWEGKTHSEEELHEALTSELAAAENRFSPELDRWGGLASLPLTAPGGFFTAVKREGKWWLADPDGNAFYSTGAFGVYPGEPGWVRGNEPWIGRLPDPEGPYADAWRFAEDEELYRRKFHGLFPQGTRLYSFATANLLRVFGADWREKWTLLTASRLRGMAVNTLSMFSDAQFIRDSGLPFVIMLQRYPTAQPLLFREFPDVFSEDFARDAERYAEQLVPYAGDPQLIGYFMNNEPTFMWSEEYTLAEKAMEQDAAVCASKRALLDWLRDRYPGPEELGRAWQYPLTDLAELEKPILSASGLSPQAKTDLTAFSGILLRRYVSVPALACRRAAPHHLNLGMRYAGISGLALETVEFSDVFSVNYYGTDPKTQLDAIAAALDKPILISEFHFGAYDAGLPAASLVPFETQAERAAAYERFARTAASHPNAVGTHWFAWNDQPLWGRYDCENYQFGFVDVCCRPYQVFCDAVRRTSHAVYGLHRQCSKQPIL